MKKLLFTLLTFLAVNASAQLVYPTDVFWEFLSGYQAGDSTTDNYLKYYNNYLLLKTDKRDAKVLQIRNELNTVGISTLFIDANGNGGLSIDSAGGQTVIKLRGALNDHSYINNSHVSIGRAGQTQDYGGNVDGAKFTVSDEREPGYGLWDADNYQMMLQSSKDSIGGYVGLAFTSENATQDKNVGAFINYLKTGNNGKGELHFGTKTATGSLANGIHAMKIDDGSVTIDSTIVLPNIPAINSDTVLVARNDSVGYKVLAPSTNIYNSDGTLTGNRTITSAGYDLSFDGKLGIGTATPSEKLSVVGKIYLNDGGKSVFIGEGAGRVDDASDNRNVGIGYQALYSNTTGTQNTANGYLALYSNTTGDYNTANGYQALRSNTTGGNNVANGFQALVLNTTGNYNTANGTQALSSNTTGGNNVANGFHALVLNTTGSNNTANGNQALFSNTTGDNNVANGYQALRSNTTGSNNIAIGYRAGRYLADGVTAATNVANSLFLGVNTSPLADGQTNQIVIGHDAKGIGSNTVVLGNDNVVTTALKGNVGIGTTSPNSLLTIAGDLEFTGAGRDILMVDNLGASLEFKQGSDLYARFVTSNGAEKIEFTKLLELSGGHNLIVTPGNVGIGTTSPTAKLHADNTATTGVAAIIENSNAANTANIAEFQNSTGTVAKVGVNGGIVAGSSTLSSSAVLQANSTTRGFLPPRMTGAEAEAIATPAEGLMIYSTDGSGVTITSKGWWGYEGSTWVQLN